MTIPNEINYKAKPEPPADGAVADERPCTCHPDDNPPRPCSKRYALNECKDFAEREVAELVGCLHDLARADWLSDETADILTRAADLLSRLAPQPVPVSERLPEPTDCDVEGRCWWWRIGSDRVGDWTQQKPHNKIGLATYSITHWLPANALPLPAEEV